MWPYIFGAYFFASINFSLPLVFNCSCYPSVIPCARLTDNSGWIQMKEVIIAAISVNDYLKTKLFSHILFEM